MPPDPLLVDDSDYASSEDSDFAPETAPVVASDESSDSESETDTKNGESNKKPRIKSAKRKRGNGVEREEAEDLGIENSGDEEIVGKGLKKQRKKGKKGREEDEDEGGEGGFVKTRRMAALASEEKKPLASIASATVDVDALWASMTNAAGNETTIPRNTEMVTTNLRESTNLADASPSGRHANEGDEQSKAIGLSIHETLDEDMIMIQRTYNFAGKVHVEEKLVSRDSAEARLWLQSQSLGKAYSKPQDMSVTKPLRPPKKARKSIFEPVIESLPNRKDLKFGLSSVSRDSENRLGAGVTAKKLNTVEKSKMDWAGFVDKEGIKDELETAGKAKGAYLDQREFLARVEDKREEEARKVRMKGRDDNL